MFVYGTVNKLRRGIIVSVSIWLLSLDYLDNYSYGGSGDNGIQCKWC